MNCVKVSFENGQIANERTVQIRNEEKEKGNRAVLRPYKCEHCNKYHLTSKTKADREKTRKKSHDEKTKLREQKFIQRESEYYARKFDIY